MQQSGGIGVTRRAIAWMHAQQHMVEHGKTDRAGVNVPEDRRATAAGRFLGAVSWRSGRLALASGQPAKHQQVVLRGVVEMRRQLRIEQVRDMQVHELQAAQGLQRGLDLRQQGFELLARAGDPHMALSR